MLSLHLATHSSVKWKTSLCSLDFTPPTCVYRTFFSSTEGVTGPARCLVSGGETSIFDPGLKCSDLSLTGKSKGMLSQVKSAGTVWNSISKFSPVPWMGRKAGTASCPQYSNTMYSQLKNSSPHPKFNLQLISWHCFRRVTTHFQEKLEQNPVNLPSGM